MSTIVCPAVSSKRAMECDTHEVNRETLLSIWGLTVAVYGSLDSDLDIQDLVLGRLCGMLPHHRMPPLHLLRERGREGGREGGREREREPLWEHFCIMHGRPHC